MCVDSTNAIKSALLAVLVVGASALPGAAQQAADVQAPATAAQAPARRDLLPSWLRLRGEFRERVEGMSGAGFTGGRDDAWFLSRFRVDAAIAPDHAVSARVQVQDARVADKTIGPTGVPFRAPVDLRMAYVDLGRASGPVSVRVGRQELVYGEQRLVGHVSWLNSARTFDGVRARFQSSKASVDVFGTSVVRLLPDELDRSGHGNRFAGAHASTGALVPRGTLEPFLYWRRDQNRPLETGGAGTLSTTTLGVRLAGAIPGDWSYGAEAALQRGDVGVEDVHAWAGHVQLTTPVVAPLETRVTTEYNYATGDADAADGVQGTFDQLYPTPHDKYGLADQVGWRNLHHVRLGAALTPWSGLPVTVNYHTWWLAESADGLYSAGGARIAFVAGGAASRHVGQELDVQVRRRLSNRVNLAAGYAHIFTGDFLREATPGASYSAPYLMLTYVFLGE